jgi:hypothetical protein
MGTDKAISLDTKVRYTVRMHRSTYEKLKLIATKEDRSLAKQLESIINLHARLYHKELTKETSDVWAR